MAVPAEKSGNRHKRRQVGPAWRHDVEFVPFRIFVCSAIAFHLDGQVRAAADDAWLGVDTPLENRALATSSCIMVLATKVNLQSMGERSSRVREYRCDNNR